MGLSVAKNLAAKGANVILVARNTEKLKKALEQVMVQNFHPTEFQKLPYSLLQALASHNSQRFWCISGDVSKSNEATRLIREASAWNNDRLPDIVWCVAGSAFPGLLIETSTSIMRDQMDTNYWSCVEMAQAILPAWIASEDLGHGNKRHLIFTSSVVAFFPIAGYAPYAPSKAAIRSLSDTLAQEVLLYGDEIKIHTIFPGSIRSPGFERENISKPEITHILEEADPIQLPDDVAAKAITGLERGEYLVTVNWLGDAMRGCAWGGSQRNNWILDTTMTWITSIAWLFIRFDLNNKVKRYRNKIRSPKLK